MHKLANALKLPKIEDYAHKSQPYLNANKEMLSSFQHSTPKAENKQQKGPNTVHTEGDSLFIGQRRNLSSDKGAKYNEAKEGTYFINSSIKQNWILKKMEAQRENLTKKPQFLGLRDNSQQLESYRNKPGRYNQPTGSDIYDKGTAIRRKVSTEDPTISKSVNFGAKIRPGRPSYPPEANESLRKKLGMKVDDNHSSSDGNLRVSLQDRLTPSEELFNSSMKPEKGKFNQLSPIDEKAPFDQEKNSGKVDFDIILKIEEKLRHIFESIETKSQLIVHTKAYVELLEPEEPFIVDTLFLDNRVRRNLKTYLMLEKTAVFVLLHLVSEDSSSQDLNIRNICHYLYSNFLNFADTVSSKLDLLPKFHQIPPIEKLKQIAKKKVAEIDRSFGLEQVNKLLIKTLRTSCKSSIRKEEQSTKLEHLFEKIEFGLMMNYFDELKTIFQELITKHRIIIQTTKQPRSSKPELTESPKKRKTEKLKTTAKATPTESPVKVAPEREYLLPPPIAKPGQEDKPIYTLVLDMDETLIHFEEVAGKGRFFVRPHAEKFLKEMSEIYEVVIFTAGMQDYADAVLNILDPPGYITHRLYRQHTTINTTLPGVIKDLSRIGRDLTRTLLIDNAPENFRLQVDNGLEITSWYNDPYDTELLDFIPFLRGLVEKKVDDVRKSVRKYKEKKKLKRH